MIVLIVVILLAVLVAGSIESNLHKAFSDPNWLRFDEEPTERERLEMENDEFNWGHNIKNYMEE